MQYCLTDIALSKASNMAFIGAIALELLCTLCSDMCVQNVLMLSLNTRLRCSR